MRDGGSALPLAWPRARRLGAPGSTDQVAKPDMRRVGLGAGMLLHRDVEAGDRHRQGADGEAGDILAILGEATGHGGGAEAVQQEGDRQEMRRRHQDEAPAVATIDVPVDDAAQFARNDITM